MSPGHVASAIAGRSRLLQGRFPRAVTSRAARTIARKSPALRLAPPTRAPSMSGQASSSAALSGLTLPPYWTTTRAAVASPNASASRPRMNAWAAWACSGVAVSPVPIAQTGS